MRKQTVWKKFAGVGGTLALLVLAACGQQTEEQPAPADQTAEVGGQTDETPDDAVAVDGEWTTLPNGVRYTVDEDGLTAFDFASFPASVMDMGEPVYGGTLYFGNVVNSPWANVMHPVWSNTADTSIVFGFAMEAIYGTGADLLMDQSGAATWEVDETNTIYTFTIREGVYWHDGTPVTAEDWAFTYYVLANPLYTEGQFVRFTGQGITDIVGIMDYHNGDADEIAGITVIDERTIQFEFEAPSPAHTNGGIWSSPLPKHLFEDIPVDEMVDSVWVRETPIGFGPFKFETNTPGESATFVRFEDYWRGRPALDGVVVRGVAPDLVGEELAAGNFDIVSGVQAAILPYFTDLTNVQFLGSATGSYEYISFNWGSREDGEIVMDESLPLSDVNLRRAIWQAIDLDEIGRRVFSGLHFAANGILPPSLGDFHNPNLQRPESSIEAARQTLADAGFEDTDGDGFVEQPDGSPLELNFFVPNAAANQANQIYHAVMIQQWEAAGINVNLINEHEWNVFLDYATAEPRHPEVDMFMMSWSLGTALSPQGRYGISSANNLARYTSPELEELLARIDSEEAVDGAYRLAAMNEWQEYMMENVVVAPTRNILGVQAANNRVRNFDLGTLQARSGLGGHHWYQVSVTADAPEVNN